MVMIPKHDDTPDYAGLTYTQVLQKHRRLRGTDDLRYPPTRAKRCQHACGMDDFIDGDKVSHHQCYYAPSHLGPCQFSSECGAMHREVVVQ